MIQNCDTTIIQMQDITNLTLKIKTNFQYGTTCAQKGHATTAYPFPLPLDFNSIPNWPNIYIYIAKRKKQFPLQVQDIKIVYSV